MAASDLIAAAIAAFSITVSPPPPANIHASDGICVETLLRPAMFSSDDYRFGGFHVGELRADGFAVGPFGLLASAHRRLAFDARCLGDDDMPSRAHPALALAHAVDRWLDGMRGVAEPQPKAQPRAAVAVVVLPTMPAPDFDAVERAVRDVIALIRQRDPTIDLDVGQLTCLQRALYFEARGEGMLGQAAVAHVALNRVGTRPGRTTICDVVQEPGQFAPYLGGEPDDDELAQTDDDATRLAAETAAMVMAGYVDDPSRGGQYFYAPRLVKGQPAWVKGMKETARIGAHRFFVEVDARPHDARLARD